MDLRGGYLANLVLLAQRMISKSQDGRWPTRQSNWARPSLREYRPSQIRMFPPTTSEVRTRIYPEIS